MEPISLYSCLSCQKVIDSLLIAKGTYSQCECGGKRYRQVNPTSAVLKRYKQDFKWRYYKMLLQYFWEKVYGA